MEQLIQNETINSSLETNIISNENLVDGQSDLNSCAQMSHDVSQYGPVISQLLTELKRRYTPPNQSQIKCDEAKTPNISGEGDLFNGNEIFEPNLNILDDCNAYDINSKLQNRNDVHDTEQQSCSNACKSNLKLTILPNHTVKRKRSFSCKICKKVFNRKSNLKTHMFIHSGEKPFSCSVCNKRFTLKATLNNHIFTHTGEKPFSCSVCNKRFIRKATLNNHIFTHTDEKPFSCNVCNKRFTQKANLKTHMLTHSGEKPFLCSVCSKSFSQKSHRNAHMLTHNRKKVLIF